MKQQLRLWPGVMAVAMQWTLRYLLPLWDPGQAGLAVMSGIAGALAVALWWLLFSRAPWKERIGAPLFLAVAVLAIRPMLHPSIAGGMMGMLFPIYVLPLLSLALVVWAAAGRRPMLLLGLTAAACGSFALLRTEGITGDASSQFAWRWTPDPEEKLVASIPVPAAPELKLPPAEAPKPALNVAAPVPDWPGFRGPNRDSVVRGTRIRTDWTASPPKEIWRQPVGPGWSSFAVGGGLIYTQEQRGQYELVSCYRLSNGEAVWAHRDEARFWESNGGAGPRGTPTLADGRVYSLGATGILNVLDAATGALVWTRNAAADTEAKLPGWGFSSSPVVYDGNVIVAASGRLAAYGLDGGNPHWVVRTEGGSYSSPHLLTIAGVPQIVMLSGFGATSVRPADGAVLWKHAWDGSTILQPALTAEGALLITTGDMSGGAGTRRLALTHDASQWTVEERWTSNGLKPYFNDVVVHKGHVYGFDGSILACISLEEGKRKWKGGRYGHGQMLLLADQDLLLVLSEEGEIALVSATPDQFTEVARFRVMQGKTWNHPVLVGNTLLVRNGEEMVALRF